jgi:hypothetical protein
MASLNYWVVNGVNLPLSVRTEQYSLIEPLILDLPILRFLDVQL